MNNINEYLPHGFCIAWNPQLLAMHVISDVLIALAYFSIPVGIVYVAKKRADAVFQPIYYLFAAFILACGVTHVMGILTLWYPLYYTQGIAKIVTALVSVATAVYLLPKLKYIMALPDLGKLSQMNQDLSEEIESRRRSEASLIESQALALQAQKTQAAFLANMSHEIRTPMNGVMGAIDLLLDTKLSEAQRRLAEASKKSARSLLVLLNDILDLSKVESGQMTLREEDASLVSIFEEVASALSFEAEQKKLELVCPANKLPLTDYRVDSVRLRQILLNLVGNAVKFTESGFIVVSCHEIGRSDKESVLEFRVKDSGIGIRPEEKNKLFQRFKQLDNSSTRRAQGSGLGLAIVKQLVDLMGGSLRVSSEPGKGTEFVFTLNLKFATVQKPSPLQARQSGFLGTVHLALEGKHTSAYIAELLRHWGYAHRVHDAGSATDLSVETFKNGDVLLVSARLAASGLAHLDRLAEQADIKIGLLIAQSEQTLLDTLAGLKRTDRIIMKPLVQADVRRALNALTDNTNNAQQPVAQASAENRPRYRGRVLVVEDSTMNQMVICKVLEAMGIEVLVANNGQESIDMLQKEAFDAVLMDGQMPVMDGYEATRIIRSGTLEGINQSIPVIALTAHAMSGEDQRCYDAGMNDYLTKPLSREKLNEVLSKYMEKE